MIFRSGTVIRKCSLLYEACSILQIPCIVTEQNSKVFGNTEIIFVYVLKLLFSFDFFKYLKGKTVPDIKVADVNGEVRSNTYVHEKMQFSMLSEDVRRQLDILNRKQARVEIMLCLSEFFIIYFS